MTEPGRGAPAWRLIASVAILIAACRSGGQDSTPDAFEVAADAMLVPLVETGNFSGVVFVSSPERVLLHKGYGGDDLGGDGADLETARFRIASVSKTFTSAAVLHLVDRGVVSLDEPIDPFVPELPGSEELTAHRLLTHTTGIPDINRFPEYGELSQRSQTPEVLVAIIADRWSPEDSPVSADVRYSYSNSNYNVLALLVERASGQSYGDYLAEHLLAPLGMLDTGHDDGEAPVPRVIAGHVPEGVDGLVAAPTFNWSVKTGNGSLYSTAEDLARWARGIRAGDLVSESGVAELFTAHVDGKIGYGWFLGDHLGRSLAYMNGNSPGFSAFLGHYAEDDLVVVVLENHDTPLATTVGRNLAALHFGAPAEPIEPPTPMPLGEEALAGVAGRYRYTYGVPVELSLRDAGLYFESVWPQYESLLVPTSTDEFFHRFYWDHVVIDREPDGRVIGFHWKAAPGHRAEREE